ncbi:MAG: hypothetical protein E7360_06635 [Clostridiales bacterium]|nr:hypothetical protein [Clostridiales bacterium]
MITTFSTLYILKWTDENNSSHEERSWNLEKTLQRCRELRAKGYDVGRYKLVTETSMEKHVVERVI